MLIEWNGSLEIGNKLPAMAASIPSAFAGSFVPAASYLHGGLEGSPEQRDSIRKLYAEAHAAGLAEGQRRTKVQEIALESSRQLVREAEAKLAASEHDKEVLQGEAVMYCDRAIRAEAKLAALTGKS